MVNFNSFQAISLDNFSVFGMVHNKGGEFPKFFRSPAKINTFIIYNMKFTMEIPQ